MSSFAEHHAKDFWLAHQHPLSFATDDSGVFGTTLTREYELALQHCEFSRESLIDVARNAIQQSFAPAHVKQRVLDKIAVFESSFSAIVASS